SGQPCFALWTGVKEPTGWNTATRKQSRKLLDALKLHRLREFCLMPRLELVHRKLLALPGRCWFSIFQSRLTPATEVQKGRDQAGFIFCRVHQTPARRPFRRLPEVLQ